MGRAARMVARKAAQKAARKAARKAVRWPAARCRELSHAAALSDVLGPPSAAGEERVGLGGAGGQHGLPMAETAAPARWEGCEAVGGRFVANVAGVLAAAVVYAVMAHAVVVSGTAMCAPASSAAVACRASIPVPSCAPPGGAVGPAQRSHIPRGEGGGQLCLPEARLAPAPSCAPPGAVAPPQLCHPQPWLSELWLSWSELWRPATSLAPVAFLAPHRVVRTARPVR